MLLPVLVCKERCYLIYVFILFSLIVYLVSLRVVLFSTIICFVSDKGSALDGARPLGTPPNQLSPTARLLGVFRRPQALNSKS